MRTIAVVLLLFGALGCGPETGGAPDGGAPQDGWHVLQEGLAGVALSIWGSASDDVWVVGADAGGGPLVLHWTGTEWATLDAQSPGDLWWVFGPDGEVVYMVGAKGRVLRHRRADGSFTSLTSPTEATLFGVWGPAGGPLYAVGGFVPPASGDAVVLRIDGDDVSVVKGLPSGIDPKELFFKVWGTAGDDLWVIGDRGSLLHYTGGNWSRQVMPDQPRLITITGRGKDDIVMVGGGANAVIFERQNGGAWQEVAPPYLQPLNGVSISPSGDAIAAGFGGTVLQRKAGTWTSMPAVPNPWIWHAAWIDERGDRYVAGGDFIGLVDGAVYRFGPDR